MPKRKKAEKSIPLKPVKPRLPSIPVWAVVLCAILATGIGFISLKFLTGKKQQSPEMQQEVETAPAPQLPSDGVPSAPLMTDTAPDKQAPTPSVPVSPPTPKKEGVSVVEEIPDNWKTAKGKKAGYEISFKYPDESRVSISNEKDTYDEDYADDIGIDDALIVTIRNDRSQAEMIIGSFENLEFSDYKGGSVVDWFKKNVEQDFTVEKVLYESGKTFYKITGLKSNGKTDFPARAKATVYLAVFSDTPIYANAFDILNDKDRNRILSTLWVKH